MAHRTRIQTALIISGAVVASLFFIVVALQTRRVSHLAGEVAELRSAFQRESSERNDLDVYLESNQRTVARHLREVRELLNLSPGEYRFPENEGPSG
ncbi:MAG: hypothetical protein ACOCV0_05625, partial [Alkalispirochaeta sp.]